MGGNHFPMANNWNDILAATCGGWREVVSVSMHASDSNVKDIKNKNLGVVLTACLDLDMSSIWTWRSSISTSIDFRALTAAAHVNSDSSSCDEHTYEHTFTTGPHVWCVIYRGQGSWETDLVLELSDLSLAGSIVLQVIQHDLGISQQGLCALQILPQTFLCLHISMTHLKTPKMVYILFKCYTYWKWMIFSWI